MTTEPIFKRMHPAEDEDTFQINFGSVQECVRIIKKRSNQWELKDTELAIRRTLIHLEEYSNLTLWREVYILVCLYPEYLGRELDLPTPATLRNAIRITLARAIAAQM
ncbi:MAG: hypothetical protein U9M98_03265 [Patescibacteria group bacterium]|nr:hypothetical protein [Patescibacteria group bacterium]